MTRLNCRVEMHNAERLAKLAAAGQFISDHLLAGVERAYLSPKCEPRVAQRIHLALDAING